MLLLWSRAEINCRMVRRWGLGRRGTQGEPAGLRLARAHPSTPQRPSIRPLLPPLQGGGPVRTMNLLAWGVDLVEEQLLASAGAGALPS